MNAFSQINPIVAALLGALAGFIDSIAGGGGLITLPTLTLIVGPGAHAIGTNKIVGTIGAATALWVYSRGKHVEWKRSGIFTLWIGLGSFTGSLCSPMVPIWMFRWMLMCTCPLILWIVWKKNLWSASAHFTTEAVSTQIGWRRLFEPRILVAGYGCGFYDGLWGPGGGTFMFLGLLFGVRMPILAALAASKFANTASASIALVTYASGGYVHWLPGFVLAAGMSVGAYGGARFATQRTAQIVRPVLVVVVILLIVRLFTTH